MRIPIWSRCINYAPTNAEIDRMVARAQHFLRVANGVLNASVIVGWLYFVGSFAAAFLPGGPLHHLIGSGR